MIFSEGLMEAMQDVRVRDMRIGDYEEVVSVWRRAGLPYRGSGRDSRESIEREMQGGEALFLIAENQDGIVGTALCTHDGRKGWINRLAIVPEMQGRGVGRMLVVEAEGRFSALGLKVFCCLINEDNVHSRRFFAELGYKEHEDIVYCSKRSGEDV
ncbi:MAG: putative acetyltransferase [Methanomassiliicoccales archaeon PtaU1.Bin124]|nr:MAG: putative acetyltransferase [Methanomassiliicoccales archaeon PtaU1.Bin124]